MGICASTYAVRIPDAPADQWEAYRCIQEHPDAPFLPGTIHDDGSGTRWLEVDGFDSLAVLEVREDSLKMLRETLCAVQNGAAGNRRAEHSERIGRLIAEIDRQRPLGRDGKHGDRHTPTCGCDR